MLRVNLDTASRGAEYSGKALQAFEKAMALNPGNPRALLLKGQMLFGIAKFFNSDTAEACDTLKMALEAFENDENAILLAPKWSYEQAVKVVERCE